MTDSMRHCVRCHAELHMSAQAQPHLCPDITRRLERREHQVAAVEEILRKHAWDIEEDLTRDAAEAIVLKLANMGVAND